EVERRPHLELLVVAKPDQREIDRRAARMARARRDIALAKQSALGNMRIEFGLGAVLGIARPAHEMPDAARRAIAVEHLQPEPARTEIALHRRERCRGLTGQHADRSLIAIDP